MRTYALITAALMAAFVLSACEDTKREPDPAPIVHEQPAAVCRCDARPTLERN